VSFNPGDVIIWEAMLSGLAGSVDISPRILDFSIYENIKKPYTSIQMTIVDNADLLNTNLGLDGKNNDFRISFGQTGQRPYEGQWAITAIEKSVQLSSQRTQVYSMTGYSRHMTSFPKVQKSFKGMSATDVAQSLVGQFLSTDKPLVIGAPSKGPLGDGTMPYNINGIQIWKAIRSTLLRGASSKDQSSAYTIFENQFNLVIDTLENLTNKAFASPGPTFFQKPMGRDFFLDVALQPFVIVAMKEESRINQTAQAQDASATRVFDVFDNSFSGKGEGGASTYMNIPYNSLRPRTFAPDFMGARKAAASKFDSQSVTVLVSLNTDVTVGQGFSVETLAPSGDTTEPVLDQISGPLLATEVRHTVRLNEKRMQGQTTAKGVKGTQGLND
jgi:hypothetical protein